MPELLALVTPGLAAAPRVSPAAPPSVAEPAAFRSKRSTTILVVDDDPEARAALVDLVTAPGYAVRAAADAGSALRAIAAAAPDVVLLDIEMPGLSGVDALPSVRALDPKGQVIMVSGIEDGERAQRALAAGAFDYVTKPVDLAHLQQAIEAAVVMKELGV